MMFALPHCTAVQNFGTRTTCRKQQCHSPNYLIN